MRRALAHCLVAAACFMSAGTGHAQGMREVAVSKNFQEQQKEKGKGLPAVLQNVSIDQKLNQQLSLDLPFHDELGNTVQLGQYFGNKKPVILVMAYYECPMLCTQVLNGVLGSIKALPFELGKDYQVVTVSINPGDTPELARQKKKSYLESYHRPADDPGWHFLTGDSTSIAKLAEQVGFHYVYDPASRQYAHASGIMVATPQGKISRYFYGIEYAPKTLKLALMEASEEKIGSIVDQLYLYCFHYDPSTGKYGLAIMNMVRIAGALSVVGLVAFIFSLRRKSLAAEKVRELARTANRVESIASEQL